MAAGGGRTEDRRGGLRPRWTLRGIGGRTRRRGALHAELRAFGDRDLEGFPEIPVSSPDPSRRRVVVTGCFDWLHSGHVRFFEEVSGHGELYVVVGHDANVRLLKGEGHPRFSQDHRRYMAGSVRHVHRALVSSGSGWMDAEPEIAAIGAQVYAVNEDGDKPEKREFCRAHGTRVPRAAAGARGRAAASVQHRLARASIDIPGAGRGRSSGPASHLRVPEIQRFVPYSRLYSLRGRAYMGGEQVPAHARGHPRGRRSIQELPRREGARPGLVRPPQGRGPRPGRGERGGQVHSHEDPLRRVPGGRGGHPLQGPRGAVPRFHPGPGRRHRDHLPGAQPHPPPVGGRQHLHRTGAADAAFRP